MGNLDEKRQSVVLKNLLSSKYGCMKPYSSSQGRPEIKQLFHGRKSGKGNLLAKPSEPLSTSLPWRTLIWAYMTVVTFPIVLV